MVEIWFAWVEHGRTHLQSKLTEFFRAWSEDTKTVEHGQNMPRSWSKYDLLGSSTVEHICNRNWPSFFEHGRKILKQSSMVKTCRDHVRNISCLGRARSNTFAIETHRVLSSMVERKILKQSSMVRKHRVGTSTWVYFIKRARHFYEVPDDPN